MHTLYHSLSEVYEAMYQTFINYQEEFDFYSAILTRYRCRSILELGCGTGNLARRFIEKGFSYTGLDLSDDMLRLAKKNNPQGYFVKGDMTHFELPSRFDAVILTGRTSSYLVTNKNFYDALTAINKALHPGGITCFDYIDANKFIPLIAKDGIMVHNASAGNKLFHRLSNWNINFSQSWTIDWHSVYYEKTETGTPVKIGEDQSTIRAFCKDEVTLLLQLTGFKPKETIPRPTYAFDTFVTVAQK